MLQEMQKLARRFIGATANEMKKARK